MAENGLLRGIMTGGEPCDVDAYKAIATDYCLGQSWRKFLRMTIVLKGLPAWIM